MKKLLRNESALIALLFVAFCTLTSIANPDFVSLGTVFDLVRTAVVPALMALGVLTVIISGGIDVSFTAIAAFAMYSSVKLVIFFGLGGNVAYVFVFAMSIGLCLGLINGFFIGTLRLPTLIVTLGTLSIFRGVLLSFVGTNEITVLPDGLGRFGIANLMRVEAADGTLYQLPLAVIVLALATLLVWLLLNRLVIGRCIYALGGSVVSAERIGVPVAGLQYFVYGLVGVLSGASGVVQASLTRTANPFDLVGQELTVIAAVVLGGARITGGHGTVFGTMLGVAFVALMSNSLILWGVSSTWQNIALGALILICVGIPALRNKRNAFAS
jgi:simple sugar transport system permease protein